MTDTFDEDWQNVLEDLQREETEDTEEETETHEHNPKALQDAHIAETVCNRALRDRYCWASGLGWMGYRRGRWVETTEARVAERVRRDLISAHAREAREGAEPDRLRALAGLLSAHRIRALVNLSKGILEADSGDFDQYPDLLNVGNGVIDLRTGELLAHDPNLLLTKITSVDYDPDTISTDWAAALTALPDPVAEWLQVRVGQAATGHPTPDDIMPVLQGGGSNGKTTLTGAIAKTLGGHAVSIPERVLMANPSDHPTELMTLRGARFALIEETPEARHLNVKRLKDVLGTPTMTARLIARDNVTWDCTHSLFVTSNYVPRVDESDHGTWRRLALVRFPFTFYDPQEPMTGSTTREGVPGLRERLREGRDGAHEAVLAWIIAGALAWYQQDRVMPRAPVAVQEDTARWRGESDLLYGYIGDRLKFDRAAHVMSTEMFEDFTRWIISRGHKSWGDRLLSDRFGTHPLVEAAKVTKGRVRGGPGLSRAATWAAPPPLQYTAWNGVRFRLSTDLDDDDHQASDQAKPGPVQPVQGDSDSSHARPHNRTTKVTLHSLHTDPESVLFVTPTCTVCREPLNSALAEAGDTTHPSCDPRVSSSIKEPQ